MARVRVCLPVRQGETYLREAVGSVLAQEFQDWTLVASDNASTDGTWDILRSYPDPRIRLHRRPSDIGLGANLDACLAGADEDWILFLSHDDRLRPHALRRLLDSVREDTVMVVGGTGWIGPEGGGLGDSIRDQPPSGDGRRLVERSLGCALNPVYWVSTLWRREAIDAAGGLQPEAGPFFDWSLALRVALRGSVAVVPEVLGDCRLHPESVTARIGSQARHGLELMRALDAFGRSTPAFAAGVADARRLLARRYSGRSGEPGASFMNELAAWWGSGLPLGTRLGCAARMLKSRWLSGATTPPAPRSSPR